jgi:hypothetical protein
VNVAVQFTPRSGNRRQRTCPGFTPIHSLCRARSQDLSRNHSICPPDSQFSDLDSQSRSQFPRAAAPRLVLGVMPPNQWDDDVGRDHSLFHSSQHPPWVSRSTVLRPRFTPSITLPFATCPRGKKNDFIPCPLLSRLVLAARACTLLSECWGWEGVLLCM